MTDKLSTYRDNLRHVVKPDVPRDRADSDHVVLHDFEALLLRYALIEYFEDHTKNTTEQQREIARAYVEYIDNEVRELGHTEVMVFAHTSQAKQVLEDAVFNVNSTLTTFVQDHLCDKVSPIRGKQTVK